jgi:pimeloyl-ACP methyl ester carboxylesterase
MKKAALVYALYTFAIFLSPACKQKNSQKMDDEAKMKDSLSVTPTFKSGYSDVNGIKMYYEIYGEGKPLVLIHGGGSTIQTSFGRIIPLLARSRQVIGVELQAHGRTGDRPTPISFEQDADDVAGLLKNLNVTKADVLGFSNGGNTTMQLAIRHPDTVDKIIVASAFYKRSGMQPGFWDFMKKGTMADMPQTLKDAFLAVTPDTTGLRNLFEKCSRRMLEFKDWDDKQLQSIQAKTLIVAGDADVARPEHYVEMYRLIPHCQLLVIPGGHGQFMGEISFSKTERYVDSFVLLIEEFLASN